MSPKAKAGLIAAGAAVALVVLELSLARKYVSSDGQSLLDFLATAGIGEAGFVAATLAPVGAAFVVYRTVLG